MKLCRLDLKPPTLAATASVPLIMNGVYSFAHPILQKPILTI